MGVKPKRWAQVHRAATQRPQVSFARYSDVFMAVLLLLSLARQGAARGLHLSNARF